MLTEFLSYLNRIPDVVGQASQVPDGGDLLELDYYRSKYGV